MTFGSSFCKTFTVSTYFHVCSGETRGSRTTCYVFRELFCLLQHILATVQPKIHLNTKFEILPFGWTKCPKTEPFFFWNCPYTICKVRLLSQIYKGDPRPRILLCVMASSAMGLKLGVFKFLPTTHAKTNAMHPRSLHAVQRFMRVLSSSSDCSRRRWHTHLTNNCDFQYGKNLKTRKFEPHAGINMRRFWDHPCISVVTVHA